MVKPALIEALRSQLRRVSADNYAGARDEEAWAQLGLRLQAVLTQQEQAELSAIDGDYRGVQSHSDRVRCAAKLLRWLMTQEAKGAPARKPVAPAPKTRSALRKSPQKRQRAAGTPREEDPRFRCVSTLKGVGPKTAEKLRERGLGSLGELLHLIPNAYLDRRQTRSPQEWVEGEHVVVAGKIQDFRQSFFRGRYIAKLSLLVQDPSAQEGEDHRLELRWFHRVGGLGNRVETGTEVVAVGTLSKYRGQWSMVHPEIAQDPQAIDGIGVHYPAIKGVPARTFQKACQAALVELSGEYPDPIPPRFRESHLGQWEALRALHQPGEELSIQEVQALNEGRSQAHHRLAFDECFYLQLAAGLRRLAWQSQNPAMSPLCQEHTTQDLLRGCVPFEPTAAQWRSVEEVQNDLAAETPMLRLLQGDVGSGKTFVAFAAALMAVRAGAQVALMAPTEILAKQHLASLKSWCEKAGVRVGLLTGSTRRAERESLLALLDAGEIDLLLGTHALLVEGVSFARLGLVIVDEQHRFGVEQRAALREKGQCPHLLVMTATPIPRSLALTAYGEMQVSILDEMPPGRTPPVTRLYAGPKALQAARERLISAVVDKGVLAFVVCPLVEKSEALEVSDVEQSAQELRSCVDPKLVEVVHGRMSAAHKEEAMRRFRRGEAKILVATTVIEVGVDVPEARIILIEHAERFGLAQLHQLRGRIGRGGGPSLCMLHTASEAQSTAGNRLAIMEKSADGFEVAEHDLALRGPGEVFGLRQSGVPKLRFASFRKEGLALLQAARRCAGELLSEDPTLTAYPQLRSELALREAGLGVCSTQAG